MSWLFVDDGQDFQVFHISLFFTRLTNIAASSGRRSLKRIVRPVDGVMVAPVQSDVSATCFAMRQKSSICNVSARAVGSISNRVIVGASIHFARLFLRVFLRMVKAAVTTSSFYHA